MLKGSSSRPQIGGRSVPALSDCSFTSGGSDISTCSGNSSACALLVPARWRSPRNHAEAPPEAAHRVSTHSSGGHGGLLCASRSARLRVTRTATYPLRPATAPRRGALRAVVRLAGILGAFGGAPVSLQRCRQNVVTARTTLLQRFRGGIEDPFHGVLLVPGKFLRPLRPPRTPPVVLPSQGPEETSVSQEVELAALLQRRWFPLAAIAPDVGARERLPASLSRHADGGLDAALPPLLCREPPRILPTAQKGVACPLNAALASCPARSANLCSRPIPSVLGKRSHEHGFLHSPRPPTFASAAHEGSV